MYFYFPWDAGWAFPATILMRGGQLLLSKEGCRSIGCLVASSSCRTSPQIVAACPISLGQAELVWCKCSIHCEIAPCQAEMQNDTGVRIPNASGTGVRTSTATTNWELDPQHPGHECSGSVWLMGTAKNFNNDMCTRNHLEPHSASWYGTQRSPTSSLGCVRWCGAS